MLGSRYNSKSEIQAKWEQGKRDLRSATPRAVSEGLDHIHRFIAKEVSARTHVTRDKKLDCDTQDQ